MGKLADVANIVTEPTYLANAVAARIQAAFVQKDIEYAILFDAHAVSIEPAPQSLAALHQQLGTVVDAHLAYRVVYHNAVALGLGVVEYEPEGPAAHGVGAATDWILKRLGLVYKRTDPAMAFAASAQNLRKALRDSAPGKQVTGNTDNSCRTTQTVREVSTAPSVGWRPTPMQVQRHRRHRDQGALLKKQALPGNPSRLDLLRRLGFAASHLFRRLELAARALRTKRHRLLSSTALPAGDARHT